MERHNIFSIVLIAAAINGMVSPAMMIVAIFSWIWLPSFMLGSTGLIFFLSMLVTATATLLIAGVPAALYERASGDATGRGGLWVWAASSVLLMAASLAWRFGYAPPPG